MAPLGLPTFNISEAAMVLFLYVRHLILQLTTAFLEDFSISGRKVGGNISRYLSRTRQSSNLIFASVIYRGGNRLNYILRNALIATGTNRAF